MPMFLIFSDRDHPEYGKKCQDLLITMEKLAPKYNQLLFAFTENMQYKDRKKHLGITWDEEPAIALNHFDSQSSVAFPRGSPFTVRNLRNFIESYIRGERSVNKMHLPDLPKTPSNILRLHKHSRSIGHKVFPDVVNSEEKDVVVLAYFSDTKEESSRAVINFEHVARVLSELGGKSIDLVTFDVSAN